ncbi:hypothetical protein RQP46_007210 [Phenoliferia psychrophenolica]
MQLLVLSSLLTLTLASPTSHLIALSSPIALPCATYHGRAGTSHIYHLPTSSCVLPSSTPSLSVPFTWSPSSRLFWLPQTALDESVPALVSRRQELAFEAQRDKDAQVVLTPHPVPKESIDRISSHLKSLKFNSLISTLVETFPRKPFERDVKWLSGEKQAMKEGEGWVTEFRAVGLECEQHEYADGFAPMIECVIEGTDPDAGTFVLGGHFDSRGSFGYPTAPGADDDGSGTALLLSIARHIAAHRLTFKRKVILAAFSGEEQGLLGSNWFARRLQKKGEDIVLMIQADMIGYRKPGEPRQIAFPPDSLGLQEARYLVGNISTIYAPELVPGITPACCSDHQSFGSLGFASTWVFERNGPIADPFYHNSGDLSEREGYDFEQIYLTSTVVLATLLEVAGFAFI